MYLLDKITYGKPKLIKKKHINFMKDKICKKSSILRLLAWALKVNDIAGEWEIIYCKDFWNMDIKLIKLNGIAFEIDEPYQKEFYIYIYFEPFNEKSIQFYSSIDGISKPGPWLKKSLGYLNYIRKQYNKHMIAEHKIEIYESKNIARQWKKDMKCSKRKK